MSNDNMQNLLSLNSSEGFPGRSRSQAQKPTVKAPAPHLARLHRDVDGSLRATTLRFSGAKSDVVLGRLGGTDHATAPTGTELRDALLSRGYTVAELPDVKNVGARGYLLAFFDAGEESPQKSLASLAKPSQTPERQNLITQQEIDRRREAKLQPPQEQPLIGWEEINRRRSEREKREAIQQPLTDAERLSKEARQNIIRG